MSEDDPDYSPYYGAPYSHEKTKILAEDTYHWIGRCISRWGYVDDALFYICAWALRADEEIAAVVYYRTPNLDSRTSLVHDLLASRFCPGGLKSGEHAPPLFKRWEALKKRLEEKEFRNFIAHNRTVTLSSVAAEIAARYPHFSMTDQAIFSARVSQTSLDRQRRPSKYEYVGPNELRAHYKKVANLRTDLQEFHKELQQALPVTLSPQKAELLTPVRTRRPSNDRG